MENTGKFIRFPILLTLMIFILLFIVCVAIGAYIEYKQIMMRINEYIVQIHNVSKALIETYTDACALAYESKSTKMIDALCKEIRTIKDIKEIFFVLDDGTIIAHSDKTKIKDLKGNIINDEFTYNIDMILYPHLIGSKDVHVQNYFIPDVVIPFDKQLQRYIKRYIYSDIDTNSWLISKAVYANDKSVGTVNCIVVKKCIYDALIQEYTQFFRIVIIAFTVSCIFSLLFASGIYIAKRKLYSNVVARTPIPSATSLSAEGIIKDAIPVKE